MGWTHAEAWAKRIRHWASACQRLVVLSKTQIERLTNLMPISPERCVVISNGFDPSTFDRHAIDRITLWRQLLVEHPLGWHPNGEPGTVAYTPDELSPFAEGPVLLYVGRFYLSQRERSSLAPTKQFSAGHFFLMQHVTLNKCLLIK
jgi:glycosyltransferase involved in cell wall biosynthesis